MYELNMPLAPSDVAQVVRDAGLVRSADVAAMTGECRKDDCKAVGACVAIGAFDGVHQGHRKLIAACIAEADACGGSSVVVTFDPDPSELLAGERADRRLLSVADRVGLCRDLGVDRVEVLPFTAELAQRSPREFVELLVDRLGCIKTIYVGENFRFGTRGCGTTQTLTTLGDEFGFEVKVQPLLEVEGSSVSSSRIRALLGKGAVEQAACLLERCHYVRGTVTHGRGEGTSFGFPTANMCCDPRSCLPSEGVYACIVTDGSRAWPAAVNVGAPPTFAEHRDAFLEANLLGFSGDLYDRELAVLFVSWLRASRPFSSLDELERVVLGNIAWVAENVGAHEVEVAP